MNLESFNTAFILKDLDIAWAAFCSNDIKEDIVKSEKYKHCFKSFVSEAWSMIDSGEFVLAAAHATSKNDKYSPYIFYELKTGNTVRMHPFIASFPIVRDLSKISHDLVGAIIVFENIDCPPPPNMNLVDLKIKKIKLFASRK